VKQEEQEVIERMIQKQKRTKKERSTYDKLGWKTFFALVILLIIFISRDEPIKTIIYNAGLGLIMVGFIMTATSLKAGSGVVGGHLVAVSGMKEFTNTKFLYSFYKRAFEKFSGPWNGIVLGIPLLLIGSS